MRYALLALVLAALVLPAIAATGSNEGYLGVDRVTITLDGPDALVRMEYHLEGGMRFLILLVGTGDLEQKVKRVLNYPGARLVEIDTAHAVLRVENAALDYGDGTYWFPEHRFGITVPLVTVTTPQYTQTFHRIPITPRGIGYYRV